MTVIDNLNWRYAVKKYSDKKVEQNKIDKIIEAINLSASSAGLQPYRLIEVQDEEIRKSLGEGSFNPQITEASHLLVFAAFDNITQKSIDDYIGLIAKVRDASLQSLDDFKKKLEYNFFQKMTPEENFIWAARQAYIGLGTGLVAAAEMQVDTTPMEGFDPVKFDEVLGLKEKGLRSVVILALGHRDVQKDIFAKLKKVRVPKYEFVTEIA